MKEEKEVHETKMEKPISWLLTLSLVLSLIPALGVPALAADHTRTEALTLGNTDYNDSTNYNKPLSSRSDSSEGWVWDAGSSTLILTDVNFQLTAESIWNGSLLYGIYLPKNATIVLNGTNTITLNQMNHGSFSSPSMDAIYGTDLTITGGGTLNINVEHGGNNYISAPLCGISNKGTLTIGGDEGTPTIHVTAGKTAGSSSIGIWADSLSLKKGSITAAGSETTGTSRGISAKELLDIAKDFQITASAYAEAREHDACYFGYAYDHDNEEQKTGEDYPWSKESMR